MSRSSGGPSHAASAGALLAQKSGLVYSPSAAREPTTTMAVSQGRHGGPSRNPAPAAANPSVNPPRYRDGTHCIVSSNQAGRARGHSWAVATVPVTFGQNAPITRDGLRLNT